MLGIPVWAFTAWTALTVLFGFAGGVLSMTSRKDDDDAG